MYKILKLVAIALGLLGVIFCGGILFSGISDSMTKQEIAELIEPWSSLLFFISLILLIIAVIGVLVFGLLNIISSPAKIKKTAIYTGVFVLIIVVSYLFASSFVSEADKTPAYVQRLVGMGIISVFIFGGIATVLTIVSGVKNALTK